MTVFIQEGGSFRPGSTIRISQLTESRTFCIRPLFDNNNNKVLMFSVKCVTVSYRTHWRHRWRELTNNKLQTGCMHLNIWIVFPITAAASSLSTNWSNTQLNNIPAWTSHRLQQSRCLHGRVDQIKTYKKLQTRHAHTNVMWTHTFAVFPTISLSLYISVPRSHGNRLLQTGCPLSNMKKKIKKKKLKSARWKGGQDNFTLFELCIYRSRCVFFLWVWIKMFKLYVGFLTMIVFDAALLPASSCRVCVPALFPPW